MKRVLLAAVLVLLLVGCEKKVVYVVAQSPADVRNFKLPKSDAIPDFPIVDGRTRDEEGRHMADDRPAHVAIYPCTANTGPTIKYKLCLQVHDDDDGRDAGWWSAHYSFFVLEPATARAIGHEILDAADEMERR